MKLEAQEKRKNFSRDFETLNFKNMDGRIEQIMMDFKHNDKSFQDKESALELMLRPFGRRFSKQEMRDTWHLGVRCGVEIGLTKAGLAGQKMEMYGNIKNPKHKEFLDKFYALAAEYKCEISYHPLHGMCVLNRDYSAVEVERFFWRNFIEKASCL